MGNKNPASLLSNRTHVSDQPTYNRGGITRWAPTGRGQLAGRCRSRLLTTPRRAVFGRMSRYLKHIFPLHRKSYSGTTRPCAVGRLACSHFANSLRHGTSPMEWTANISGTLTILPRSLVACQGGVDTRPDKGTNGGLPHHNGLSAVVVNPDHTSAPQLLQHWLILWPSGTAVLPILTSLQLPCPGEKTPRSSKCAMACVHRMRGQVQAKSRPRPQQPLSTKRTPW